MLNSRAGLRPLSPPRRTLHACSCPAPTHDADRRSQSRPPWSSPPVSSPPARPSPPSVTTTRPSAPRGERPRRSTRSSRTATTPTGSSSTNTARRRVDLSGYALPSTTTTAARRLRPARRHDRRRRRLLRRSTRLSATAPRFDFGLGAADSVRLFDRRRRPGRRYTWTTHARRHLRPLPRRHRRLSTTTTSTKGAANDCSSPVRINEVESNGGTPGDWVELTNIGATSRRRRRLRAHATTTTPTRTPSPPARPSPPGGFVVLDEQPTAASASVSAGADSVRLCLDDGATLVDSYDWTAHAATTYGRCPDGTGRLRRRRLRPSKGAANLCAGVRPCRGRGPAAPTRPRSTTRTTFTGDLSGLDYEPSGSAADGTLWAVQNGDGLLYQIVSDGAGGWAPATTAGWATARRCATPTAPARRRRGRHGGRRRLRRRRLRLVRAQQRRRRAPAARRSCATTRPTARRPCGATDEWNLAADFPGLGANAGPRGRHLGARLLPHRAGFVDESTGAAYDPARLRRPRRRTLLRRRRGHRERLRLRADGRTARSSGSPRSPRRSPSSPTCSSTPTSAQLWVVCDDACAGRTALFAVDSAGAFAAATPSTRPPRTPTAALANEGFAIAPAATPTAARADLLRRRQRHRRVLAPRGDVPVRGRRHDRARSRRRLRLRLRPRATAARRRRRFRPRVDAHRGPDPRVPRLPRLLRWRRRGRC